VGLQFVDQKQGVGGVGTLSGDDGQHRAILPRKTKAVKPTESVSASVLSRIVALPRLAARGRGDLVAYRDLLFPHSGSDNMGMIVTMGLILIAVGAAG
jgi:hypothetical protein